MASKSLKPIGPFRPFLCTYESRRGRQQIVLYGLSARHVHLWSSRSLRGLSVESDGDEVYYIDLNDLRDTGENDDGDGPGDGDDQPER